MGKDPFEPLSVENTSPNLTAGDRLLVEGVWVQSESHESSYRQSENLSEMNWLKINQW